MTPARTSGGRWNPAAGNAYFIAGSIADTHRARAEHTLVAVSELTGPRQLELLDAMCDDRTVMLDSGVYSFAAAYAREHDLPGAEVFQRDPATLPGFDRFYDLYCAVATRYADRLWGVVEIDLGGTDGKRATRQRIQADTGLTPIPVYHPLFDGWDYYDELADAHDRLCVGNLSGGAAPSVRLRIMWTAAERARARPGLWTHLLGLTPSPALLSSGWRGSCDSSTWLSPVRWPQGWTSWALLQRAGDMPLGMTYRRDMGDDPERGHVKAKTQAAASAHFSQAVLAHLADDTHPDTVVTA